MDVLNIAWTIIQILTGYHLVFPGLLYLLWKLIGTKQSAEAEQPVEIDYAIVVTAYQYTNTLPDVVRSILDLNYSNYMVYIVADNCDVTDLNFNSEKVILLRPTEVLGANTKSHDYAIKNFIRAHQVVTIIDSDNLLDPEYLNQMSLSFNNGYQAVQGLRAAKNLNGTIACLDAARDMYYHFYDGKLLFEVGSSATLAGSGMAFKTTLYQDFLTNNQVSGAGFDKVLQSWLVSRKIRIAFNESAVVYDEKTSKTEQLVHQRSRWINTWFKYAGLGVTMTFLGLKNFNRNQFLFGFVLLRPPLFIFLILSVLCFGVNIGVGNLPGILSWFVAFVLFVLFFLVSLVSSKADKRIYKSLLNIPKFVFYQLISLLKIRKANKISVATRHYNNTDK